MEYFNFVELLATKVLKGVFVEKGVVVRAVVQSDFINKPFKDFPLKNYSINKVILFIFRYIC